MFSNVNELRMQYVLAGQRDPTQYAKKGFCFHLQKRFFRVNWIFMLQLLRYTICADKCSEWSCNSIRDMGRMRSLVIKVS